MDHQSVDWFAEDRDQQELMHYGVKGMKWGVRNENRTKHKTRAYYTEGGSVANYANRRAKANKRIIGRSDKTYGAVKKANTKLYGKSKVGKAVSKTMNKGLDVMKKGTPAYRRASRKLKFFRNYRDANLQRLKQKVEDGKPILSMLNSSKMSPKKKAMLKSRVRSYMNETQDLYEALQRDLTE